MGVLYSYTGFNPAALEKAAALNISCCVLFSNQHPSIPEQLILNAYCCASQLGLSVLPPITPLFAKATWKDLFKIRSTDGREFLDTLIETFKELESASINHISPSAFFPKQMTAGFELIAENAQIGIQLSVRWKIYGAKLSAYLLSGTYSFADKAFVGTLCTPSIDIKGTHPGNGWELLDFVPGKSPIPTMTAVLSGPKDVGGQLVAELGHLNLDCSDR